MSFVHTDTEPASLVPLRKGTEDAPVFLFSGLGADPNELADIASRARNPKAMIGVGFCTRDKEGRFPETVASMAKCSCLAIRALQPRGPYYLVGYSFGGLVALEVARLLRETGEEVAFLGMIDTRYDSRFWPTGLFLRSQARLIRRHLTALRHLPPSAAIRMLSYRARRFFSRFLTRQMALLHRMWGAFIIYVVVSGLIDTDPVQEWSQAFAMNAGITSSTPTTSKSELADQHCLMAMGNYRPNYYDGKITLFDAKNDNAVPEFGCAPVELWEPMASEIECRTIPGTHVGIIRDDALVSGLAAVLDRALDDLSLAKVPISASSHAPRVLLVTACCWLTTTRLAFALSEAGFTVDALCPAGHSLARVKFVSATYRFRPLRPISALRRAIKKSKPDLIIPSDDYATAQLHELYKRSSTPGAGTNKLRTLIARSLGYPKQYPIFYARDQIASLAHNAEVPCPTVVTIRNEKELLCQLNRIGFPVVLKTDGSSGGLGVVIVHNVGDAKRAFQKLIAYPNIIRAFKRLIIDRDATLILPSLRHSRARVSIQPLVHGRPANAAIACWDGKVLAHVCVEVLASDGVTGPARVVRVISHPGMSLAVERMTRALRLSGLCGFDFILDSNDGSAHLIEINPRATQTCHLVSSDGKQLLASLAKKLYGLNVVDSPRRPNCDPIVLFPHGFKFDRKSPYSQFADIDTPRNCPDLVKLGLEFNRRKNRFFAKAIRCCGKILHQK
jgi:thioesterase domain-containing protein/carbamoylphosphate synthase large subunit